MSKPRIFLQMAENGGIFVGTYGSTSYSEIVEHFTKGDIICIKRNIAGDRCNCSKTSITSICYTRFRNPSERKIYNIVESI